MDTGLRYRGALPQDRDSIVALHVEGGQQAYANILPPDYLANVRPQEKADLWRERLEGGVDNAKLSLTVAETRGEIAGFACFLFDKETEFGTYLHNIYVSTRHQRQGIASGLLAAGIATFPSVRARQAVHLLVFAENRPARAFYERLGGAIVGELQRARSGSEAVALVRYQWKSAEDLRRRALLSRRS